MKQLFLVKEKKELVDGTYSVPRHEEFVFTQKIDESSWEAKDANTGEVVKITKVEKGEFVEFSFAD